MNTICNLPTIVTYTPCPLSPLPCKFTNPTTHMKVKKGRKSRRVYDFDFKTLSLYFHMPQKQAAKLLGVAVITIKRCCKRHGFKWPYRANKYKNGNRPILSVKGRAFHELPLDCLKVEEAMSECDTDTESVDYDEQVKKDFCETVFMLKQSFIVEETADVLKY